jgi:Flp pilus assembly protein TadD
MSDLISTIKATAKLTALPSALALTLLAAPLAATAYAAGDEDETPTCRKGLVWDKRKQICVPADAGLIDDDSLASYAYALAKQERFQEALDVLDLAQNQNNAKILNYRGYATRNLGRVDEGIRYYKQALALDPENVLVRNYLGQAYVKKGELAKARVLLDEIGQRCGTSCKEYVDLSAAIEGGAG